jgi:hypothetical protein
LKCREGLLIDFDYGASQVELDSEDSEMGRADKEMDGYEVVQEGADNVPAATGTGNKYREANPSGIRTVWFPLL